jgi:hypothetical protein
LSSCLTPNFSIQVKRHLAITLAITLIPSLPLLASFILFIPSSPQNFKIPFKCSHCGA